MKTFTDHITRIIITGVSNAVTMGMMLSGNVAQWFVLRLSLMTLFILEVIFAAFVSSEPTLSF